MPEIDVAALVISFLILLFSLTIHEAAHAWTASRLGDDTARRLGRVSLNPVVHIDPIGTLLLPLLALASNSPLIIGWAKPVPVNPRNMGHPRRDNILVTLAGPASNLAIAVVAALGWHSLDGMAGAIAYDALHLNVLLAVFNMLPVPPLDGGRILLGLLPLNLALRVRGIEPYGFLILIALMFTGTLGYLIGPPYYFLLKWLS